MTLKLTAEGVRKIFPSAPQIYLDELVKNQAALAKAGILETRRRLAYCMANVEHESGGFSIKNLTENINYTAERAAQIWPSRFSSAADVRAKFGTAPGWQLKMFDSVYGNRMGNRHGTSDGSRYIGRGACQHTGRDGYAEMERRTNIPLVANPELASKPEHQAALIAAFWSWKGLNGPSDVGDFNGVVKRWNGGTIGMADRKARMAGNQQAIDALPDVGRIEAEVNAIPDHPPTTSVPSHVLRKGSTGDDVKILQALLTSHGEPLKDDGDFGDRTHAAVRRFQIKVGLKDDGVVGPVTWAALEK